MTDVIACKTSKTTATGCTVYAVVIPEGWEEREQAQHVVSVNVERLALGDDTWHHVLREYEDHIILNEQGEIDVDLESARIAAKQFAEQSKARAQVQDDDEGDVYDDFVMED